MLLRRRLGRSTDDRLQEEIVPHKGELGVDVSPDEDLHGVTSQAAEVDALGEGAADTSLDITFDKRGNMVVMNTPVLNQHYCY